MTGKKHCGASWRGPVWLYMLYVSVFYNWWNVWRHVIHLNRPRHGVKFHFFTFGLKMRHCPKSITLMLARERFALFARCPVQRGGKLLPPDGKQWDSILKSHNTIHTMTLKFPILPYGVRVYFSSRLFPAFKPKCLKFNPELWRSRQSK